MGKSIGETLRDGRQSQRLSVAECAKRTHISPRYIEALEAERWGDFPSESHRTGFLKLYARFLGVYSDEFMQAYQQAQTPPAVEKPVEAASRRRPRTSASPSVTWHRLVLYVIFGLVVMYGLYHAFRVYKPQHIDLSWLKFRSTAPRLVTPKTEASIQRVRAMAEAATWLRVSDGRRLLFEGLLPAGAAKEWSGPGPYRIRVGSLRGLTLTWNDQAIDLREFARGSSADVRLPPPSEADKR